MPSAKAERALKAAGFSLCQTGGNVMVWERSVAGGSFESYEAVTTPDAEQPDMTTRSWSGCTVATTRRPMAKR
jgi:hypothetical protein